MEQFAGKNIRKMKICFIAWDRFSYGGVSRIVSGIVNSLCNDFDVTIFCLKKEHFVENIYNVDKERVRFYYHEMTMLQKVRRSIADKIAVSTKSFTYSWSAKYYPILKYSRKYLQKMINHINQEKYDIVIFSSGFEDSLQLAYIKNYLNAQIKLVSWSHASFNDYFETKGKFRAKTFELVWKQFYKNFDRVIVLSDSDVAYCTKKIGIMPKRIYNANSFSPSNISTLNTKKFISVGALSYHKGTDILINAFVKFSKNEEDWILEIYGEGPLKEYVKNKIQANKLSNRVFIYPNSNQLDKIYPTASVFLFCSRYEGFGIVQIEAMSCGLPIIASDLPITRELVLASEAGELFERENSDSLKNKMLDFINKDLTQYARNGIEFSHGFKMDKISEEWKIMLKELSNTSFN